MGLEISNQRIDVLNVGLEPTSVAESAAPAAQITQTASITMSFSPSQTAKSDLKQQLDLKPGGELVSLVELGRTIEQLISVCALSNKQGPEQRNGGEANDSSSPSKQPSNDAAKADGGISFNSSLADAVQLLIFTLMQKAVEQGDRQANATVAQYQSVQASADAQVDAANAKFGASIASALTEAGFSVGGAVVHETGLKRQGASIKEHVELGSEKATRDIQKFKAAGEDSSLSEQEKVISERKHSTEMNAGDKTILRGRTVQEMGRPIGATLGDGLNIETAQDEKDAKLRQADAEAYGKRADLTGKQMEQFLALLVQMMEMLTSASATHGQMIASSAVKA